MRWSSWMIAAALSTVSCGAPVEPTDAGADGRPATDAAMNGAEDSAVDAGAAMDAPSVQTDAASAQTDALSAQTDAPSAQADARDARTDAGDGASRAFALPPTNAPLDYQLGGPYTPPAGVRIVARDRTEPIAAGLFNICYVNGFQVQPGEEATWRASNPDLLLRDAAGLPVIDVDWNEQLLDVSTAAKRARIATIVAGWIAGCRAAGFDAVEIDNLDSFSRSRGLLTIEHAVATMALFSAAAHANGMAIAQKNSSELVGRRREMQTDFVVAEECNRYAECGTYTAAYGDNVLVIEYRRQDFTAGCAAFPRLSIVLRDRNLVRAGAAGYVFDGC